MYELILVSQSPRRREILANSGYKIRCEHIKVSEIIDKNLNLDDAIQQLAKYKAEAYVEQNKHLESQKILLLTADTLVVYEGRVLGKPENFLQAKEFLSLLSGKTHSVKTAICVYNLYSRRFFLDIATTKVQFRELTEKEIEDYIATGEPMDKAGAYGIQGLAGKFVKNISGDFDNVVGFPMRNFKKILDENNWPLESIDSKLTKQKTDNPKSCPLSVRDRLAKIEAAIGDSLKKSSRRREDVKIVAASKKQSIETLTECLSAGVHIFGENYVQEAEAKIEHFSNETTKIEWHLIGALQTKKAKKVIGKFSLLHAIDSLKVIEALEKNGDPTRPQKILLEINVASETEKSGFSLSELPQVIAHFEKMRNLSLCGFMTMPPFTEKPESSRRHFAQLREQLEKWQKEIKSEAHPMNELSMGTSQDYTVAIEEGATLVRLGTILLGERK